MVFNSGKNADRLVEHAEQPVNEGLIGMVFSTEQGFIENDVVANRQHSKHIDQDFAQTTLALLAVPFYIRGEKVGVVSCVKLDGSTNACPNRSEFVTSDLERIELASRAVGMLLELRLLRLATGLEDN